MGGFFQISRPGCAEREESQFAIDQGFIGDLRNCRIHLNNSTAKKTMMLKPRLINRSRRLSGVVEKARLRKGR